MIAKLLIQTFVWLIVFAVLLFVPAGTWHWPGAWVLLGFIAASSLLFGGWLAKSSPELLAERMRRADPAGSARRRQEDHLRVRRCQPDLAHRDGAR